MNCKSKKLFFKNSKQFLNILYVILRAVIYGSPGYGCIMKSMVSFRIIAGKLVKLAKSWSMPLGICTGIAVYAAFHFLSFLNPLKPAAEVTAEHLIPLLQFVMLFFTFCKVRPRDMKIRKWHLQVAAIQVLACLAIALPLHFFPDFRYAAVAEGLMVCIVCPTAVAAAVITGRLGGNESSLTTYTIISNIVAAVVIPLAFPLVEKHGEMSFFMQFAVILKMVFPVLICPLFAAWIVRRFFPELLAAILRYCGSLAFYLWAFSLIMIIAQALRSVVNGHFGAWLLWVQAGTSLVLCVILFFCGKILGGRYGDRTSAGQAMGQKNTVFAIWVSVAYLSPVVSVAPSCYILWQNIFNSWQLWRRQTSGVQPRKGE